MQIKAGADRDPFEWIFIAKGLGIILVVVGHFHPEASPAYWSEMVKIIYSFHMPMFFALSGYLYSHGKYSYTDLVKTKTKRLLYPFVSIAGTFFMIKYVAGLTVNLDKSINFQSVYALLYDPVNSYMPLLWFVHALFVIFVLFPLARLFLNNISIFILLIAVNVIFGSDYLVFGKAFANMPFFVVGVILRENVKLSRMLINANWSFIFTPLVLFCSAYAILLSVSTFSLFRYPAQFFLGAVGTLFIINLSHAISSISDNKTKDVLVHIGYYSMTIYLFHTLFESSVRIAFFQIFKQNLAPFELIAAIAITCGVSIPLMLEKDVLRKNWVIRKFVLGLG